MLPSKKDLRHRWKLAKVIIRVYLSADTVRALGFAMLLSQGLGAMLAYAMVQGQDCNTIAVRPRYASGLVLVGYVYVDYNVVWCWSPSH